MKGITVEQFNEVYWPACYAELLSVPQMFQQWASKQVMGITGTNVRQAHYTPGHDKTCPSCNSVQETCRYVLWCEEKCRVDLMHKSINILDLWLANNDMDEELHCLLVQYAYGQGGTTMQELVDWQESKFQCLANSMNTIGW